MIADEMNSTIETIRNETGITPAGWLEVIEVRNVWSAAYPELKLYWTKVAPKAFVPIYRHEDLPKVISVFNMTENRPELNVPDTSSLSREKNRERASVISLTGEYILVENFPLEGWNYEKAKKVFSALASDFNFAPANATS
ncbi:MAG: hypothetical protein NTX42_00175 [Methanothrix sp.]|nr:hypothetical protein [Methanothrix sp.]